jgi:predicted dehydrogenase
MDFALIGDHPDGLAMARALVATSRHRLMLYAGPGAGEEWLRRLPAAFELVDDVEEALARLEIPCVIVADDIAYRPDVLRRALQSDKHVLCVHPADLRPDIAYEAGMIQADTRKLLLPLLAERLAPGLTRLDQLVRNGALGPLQVIECERTLALREGEPWWTWESSPLVALWDGLRLLGGEVREVSALAAHADELQPSDPLTLTGRFEAGTLFRVLLTPGADGPRGRILVRGARGQAELLSPAGPYGPAQLRVRDGDGERVEEVPAWDPWPALAAAFDDALAGRQPAVTWLDATRCLELFDAARHSVERERVVPMVYQEFTETGSFKGIMTALGCGMLWVVLLLLFIAPWAPQVLYVIVSLLLLFLVLQLLRWVLPAEAARRDASAPSPAPRAPLPDHEGTTGGEPCARGDGSG